MTMNARVAAIQTKTFLEADEQKRNIERAGEYVDNFVGYTISRTFFDKEG
jgi:hypothetical protein